MIFDRFSIPKSIKNQSKVEQQIIQTATTTKNEKTLKNVELFAVLATSAIPCWSKKSITIVQHPSKNTSQMTTPSWTDFGANLAPFWGGSGGQVGAKSIPKSKQKLIEIKMKFALHFWSVLGPNLAPKWADIGGKLGPQTTPKFIPKPHRKRWLSKSDATWFE